jgi:hypothetical protein
MRFFHVLNESNVKLRKSESYHLGRLENENVSNMYKIEERVVMLRSGIVMWI